MVAPHPIDDLGRGHAARRRDDDAGGVLGSREDVERQLRKVREQTGTEGTQAFADRRAERAMDRERLSQSDVRGRIDGAGLEARCLVLQCDVPLEVHRALRPPAQPVDLEALEITHPERADAKRTVEPFVSEERVGVGAEPAHVHADLTRGLRAVDDHRRAGSVRETRRLPDREDLAALTGNERDDQGLRATSERALELREERFVVGVREHRHLIATPPSLERRHERAAVLLGRGDDPRARRKPQTADERVQRVGRGLSETDVHGAARISDEVRDVLARRGERCVVRVVAHVREHADAREPGAVPVRGPRGDGERRARARNVAIEEVPPQRLQRLTGNVGLRLELWLLVHPVVIPRMARPAVNSAANPSASDWPRGWRPCMNVAASGIARTRAKP